MWNNTRIFTCINVHYILHTTLHASTLYTLQCTTIQYTIHYTTHYTTHSPPPTTPPPPHQVKKKDAYSLNIADNYGDKYSAEKHEYAKFSHRANLYEGGGATCNNNAAAAAAASRCRTLPINVGASTSSANLCADDDDDLEAYNPCGGGGGGMDSLASSYDNLTVAPSLRERCRGTDCEFYGSSNTLFLCSLCYKRREWA